MTTSRTANSGSPLAPLTGRVGGWRNTAVTAPTPLSHRHPGPGADNTMLMLAADNKLSALRDPNPLSDAVEDENLEEGRHHGNGRKSWNFKRIKLTVSV